MNTHSINLDIVPDIFCNSKGQPSAFKLLISKTIMKCCEHILFSQEPLWNRYRPLNNYRFFNRCYNMLERCLKTLVRIIYYVCKYLLKKNKPTDKVYQAYIIAFAKHILENNKAEDVFKVLNTKASKGWVHDVALGQRELIRELFKMCTSQYLEVARPEPVAMVRLSYYSVWGGKNGLLVGKDILTQYAEKMKAIDAYATGVIIRRYIDFYDPLDRRDYAVAQREIPKKRAQFFRIYAEEQLAALSADCLQICSDLSQVGLEVGIIPQLIVQYADEAIERIFIYTQQTKYNNADKSVELIIYDPMIGALAQFCIDHPVYRDLSKVKELLSYLPEGHQKQAMQTYCAQYEATDIFHKFENQFQDYQEHVVDCVTNDQASSDAVISACQQVDKENSHIALT